MNKKGMDTEDYWPDFEWKDAREIVTQIFVETLKQELKEVVAVGIPIPQLKFEDSKGGGFGSPNFHVSSINTIFVDIALSSEIEEWKELYSLEPFIHHFPEFQTSKQLFILQIMALIAQAITLEKNLESAKFLKTLKKIVANNRRRYRNPNYRRSFAESSIDGLEFEVGSLENGFKYKFKFGCGSADYFAIIGGRPGFGKSVLLHNIIIDGCQNYWPSELEFYLFDYANGNSFLGFDKLPHVKVLSITNEREYGISTLNYIFKEMKIRSELFKESSLEYNTTISKYEDYRKITDHTIPRIVVIIDEFQVILSGNARLSDMAGKSIENIIKEARKYGIHLILCTQKYTGLNIDISLITLRIAFNLSAIDSEKIIGNNSSSKLTEVGQAVANNKNGESEFNVYFSTFYNKNVFAIIDDIKKTYVYLCEKLSIDQEKNQTIFDSLISSDISNNCNINIDNVYSKESEIPRIYLGKPKYLSDNDLCFRLKNSYRYNILYLGKDISGSIRSILLTTHQILCQSEIDSKAYIINNIHQSDSSFNYQKDLKSIPANLTFHYSSETENVINEIHTILTSRISDSDGSVRKSNSRIVFVGINLDSLREFRELKNGFSSNNDDIRAKLIDILKNGPEVNIHSIIYTPLLTSLYTMLGSNSLVDLFTVRIITKGQQDLRGIIDLRQDDIPIRSGHCYLRLEDPFEGESLMFNPDPFVIYNMYSKSISEYVNSIFDNQLLGDN